MRRGLLVYLFVLVLSPAAHSRNVTPDTKTACECDEQGGTEQTTYTLRWTGDPGEANAATVSWQAGALHLSDSTAAVVAGNGCTSAGSNEAVCRADTSCDAVRAGLDCNYTFD